MIIFDGWQRPLQICVVGLLAYAALIVILRASGKRTLAKLSAFDFLVTLALGSCLATVVLNASTPLVDGMSGILMLVSLQFGISWLAARWPGLRRLLKSQPSLLLEDGVFLDATMVSQRVGRDDVLGAIRKSGAADLSQVRAVVLEADGSLSVIRDREADLGNSTLVDVSGFSGSLAKLKDAV